ncbi:MAG: M23 family metallopeptidase [Mariprofundaceae bacterium]|nr:M23 family metallopeptidase [Mariprofundaceae bacterium]
MAILLNYILSLCLLLFLSGCFHSKHSIHTIPYYKNSQIKQKNIHRYSSNTYHTVKKGDSLYTIGQQFGVSYHSLAKRNHLHYPYTIQINQKIYLSVNSSHKYRKKHSKARHSKHKQYVNTRIHTQKLRSQHKLRNVHLRWPVQGPISSPFGKRGNRMHDGIDIAVRDGTPVHAAASGTVVYSDNRLSGYGRLVIIRHDNEVFTAYAHNQRLLVKVGQHVKAGQLISKSGHSGHSTGPHVHFEVRIKKTPVNPMIYLPQR